MSEELFGPILPIIKADISDAVACINRYVTITHYSRVTNCTAWNIL